MREIHTQGFKTSSRSDLNSICLSVLALNLFLLAHQLPAEDWPQFRGADARGVADHPNLPERWSETENVLWKQPIAGRGWSSPIITGGRVYLTTVTRDEGTGEAAKPGLYFGGNRRKPEEIVHNWKILCFQLSDGKELWQQTLHRGKPRTPRHIKNSYASETPVTDGEHIYVLFGDVGLFCLTLEGDPLWSKELPPCKTRFDWGTAASPVLHEDRLYWVSDNEDESFVEALNKKTGEPIWRKNREEKSNWATPFIWQNAQRTEIITPGTGKTRSYDLDGNLLYELSGASSITIAQPYTAHDLLYVSSGYVLDKKKPLFAIRPGASGDISLSENETSNNSIAWCQKQAAPYNPTTLVYKDLLYVLYDRGFFAAFNATTGKPIYEKKRLRNGRAFTSSPWASNSKIFCLNEYGETFVIKAGADYELSHINKLESQQLCMATPAIADGKILLRTGDAIYCIGKK